MRRTRGWSAIVLALCTGVGALESPADLLAMKMNTQLLRQTEGTMTGLLSSRYAALGVPVEAARGSAVSATRQIEIF